MGVPEAARFSPFAGFNSYFSDLSTFVSLLVPSGNSLSWYCSFSSIGTRGRAILTSLSAVTVCLKKGCRMSLLGPPRRRVDGTSSFGSGCIRSTNRETFLRLYLSDGILQVGTFVPH